MHADFDNPLLFSDLKRHLLNFLSFLSMKRMKVITVASYKLKIKIQISGHGITTNLVHAFIEKRITSY